MAAKVQETPSKEPAPESRKENKASNAQLACGIPPDAASDAIHVSTSGAIATTKSSASASEIQTTKPKQQIETSS